MFIVSREKGIILNLDNATEVYTGNSDRAIVAKQTDNRIIPLVEYETEGEARTAIEMIAEEMGRKDIVYIPSREQVKARAVNDRKGQHHNTGGKKTKGHGGS